MDIAYEVAAVACDVENRRVGVYVSLEISSDLDPDAVLGARIRILEPMGVDAVEVAH